MDSLKKTARIAGALILMITVLAPFSMMYVPSTLIVPGDATATASNIMASQGLLRLGIVSDAIVVLLEVAIVVMLYLLLEPVSRTLSLISACARLSMTIVQGVNMLFYFAVLLLLGPAGYLTAFQPDQLHALALLCLDAHEHGVLLWGVFFGLHLLFLGVLVYRSGYIPRIVGPLLVFASLCYFINDFGTILLPQYRETFATIGLLSSIELVLPLWLLAKGVGGQPPAQAETG